MADIDLGKLSKEKVEQRNRIAEKKRLKLKKSTVKNVKSTINKTKNTLKQSKPILNKLKIGNKIKGIRPKGAGGLLSTAFAAWDYQDNIKAGYKPHEALLKAGLQAVGGSAGAGVGGVGGSVFAIPTLGASTVGGAVVGGSLGYQGAGLLADKILRINPEKLARRNELKSLFINKGQELKAQVGGAN
tara:strand:+ start:61 stop:621 length:561 start_codon:yes stop_codon:yes gene_type:complete